MSEEIAFFCSILVTYILYLHHKLYMLKKEVKNFFDEITSDTITLPEQDFGKNKKENKDDNH